MSGTIVMHLLEQWNNNASKSEKFFHLYLRVVSKLIDHREGHSKRLACKVILYSKYFALSRLKLSNKLQTTIPPEMYTHANMMLPY